jgi:hypothetical protein
MGVLMSSEIDSISRNRCICSDNSIVLDNIEIEEFIGTKVPNNIKIFSCKCQVHDCICKQGFHYKYFRWYGKNYYYKYDIRGDYSHIKGKAYNILCSSNIHDCICTNRIKHPNCVAKKSCLSYKAYVEYKKRLDKD